MCGRPCVSALATTTSVPCSARGGLRSAARRWCRYPVGSPGRSAAAHRRPVPGAGRQHSVCVRPCTRPNGTGGKDGRTIMPDTAVPRRPRWPARRSGAGARGRWRPGRPRHRAGRCPSAAATAPGTGPYRANGADAIAAAASRRARAGSILTGYHRSGSRPLSAHRACLATRAHKASSVTAGRQGYWPWGPPHRTICSASRGGQPPRTSSSTWRQFTSPAAAWASDHGIPSRMSCLARHSRTSRPRGRPPQGVVSGRFHRGPPVRSDSLPPR